MSGGDGLVDPLDLLDMTREQLLAKQAEYNQAYFTARREGRLIARLIELIDKKATSEEPA